MTYQVVFDLGKCALNVKRREVKAVVNGEETLYEMSPHQNVFQLDVGHGDTIDEVSVRDGAAGAESPWNTCKAVSGFKVEGTRNPVKAPAIGLNSIGEKPEENPTTDSETAPGGESSEGSAQPSEAGATEGEPQTDTPAGEQPTG